MTVTLEPTSPHTIANWALCLVGDALINANRPEVQRAYVAAGQVAWDDCCGMLVAAPERTYRSVEFPVEFTAEEDCYLGVIVVELVVLLVRCVPTVDDRGRAPAAEALDAAYRSLLDDAAVVWNALICADLYDEWQRANLSQTFVGADGGCIGVETRVTIGVPWTRWRIR